MIKLNFYPGFDIRVDEEKMMFEYGEETFGPEVERRRMDDIRKSLRNANSNGPEIPYAIAMDVGKKRDLKDLINRSLLYGAVIYSKGRFGQEPVRSQGHIHSVSASCGSSTPEVYEIWSGEAIIYMQESAKDNPGKCFAVYAGVGDLVIVPPFWAHYTVNANPNQNMSFGAWCIRDYGFDYEEVRSHGGLAYFPILDVEDKISWTKNESYKAPNICLQKARKYPEFGLKSGVPIYTQYEGNRELFTFVTNPQANPTLWQDFEP